MNIINDIINETGSTPLIRSITGLLLSNGFNEQDKPVPPDHTHRGIRRDRLIAAGGPQLSGYLHGAVILDRRA